MLELLEAIGFIWEAFAKWRFSLALIVGIGLGWIIGGNFDSAPGIVIWVLCSLGGGAFGIIWQTRANPS